MGPVVTLVAFTQSHVISGETKNIRKWAFSREEEAPGALLLLLHLL